MYYSLLLAANALGALTAGFALEASGWLQPKPLTPFLRDLRVIYQVEPNQVLPNPFVQ